VTASTMRFSHDPAIWRRWPQLSAGALALDGVTGGMDVAALSMPLIETARRRLASENEGAFPEIRAWRAVFAEMGLKPTQVRCAAEALLRRLRIDGALPRTHPLVELCNAVSVAFAVPVAVFDPSRIVDHLTVRFAQGDENHLTFGGVTEAPSVGEVVFCDAEGYAHARRWCHRQSARSSIGPETMAALVVIEAAHDGASQTVESALGRLVGDAARIGLTVRGQRMLSASQPVFDGR
jgi:DNA/RNA-binding domain of Phe-tRNA-synthetase-like protein